MSEIERRALMKGAALSALAFSSSQSGEQWPANPSAICVTYRAAG
jgi:hypothetical protein